MAGTFQIGRAILRNFTLDASPSDLAKDGDRLSLRGTFTPSQTGGAAEGDAFEQQWLGMSEDPDRTVPIQGPARFGVDGFWFPETTSVTYLPRQTDESGQRKYAGEFRRLRPSFAQGGEGFKGTLRQRSTAVHNIPDNGYLWTPSPLEWQEDQRTAVAPESTVELTDLSTGVVQGIDYAAGVSGAGPLSRVAMGPAPSVYYVGAATIERRNSASDAWYPIHGRQVPRVPDAGDVRIGNGLIRATFPYVGTPGTGTIRLEAFSQANLEWRAVGNFNVGGFDASAQPAVVVNTPEVCTLRVPVNRDANPGATGFVSMTVQRGNWWIDCDLESRWLQESVLTGFNVRELAVSGTGTAVTGGIVQSTLGASGQLWFMLSPYEQTGSSSPPTREMAVSKLNPYFALSVVIDNSTTGHLELVATREAYWKIVAAACYPVSL